MRQSQVQGFRRPAGVVTTLAPVLVSLLALSCLVAPASAQMFRRSPVLIENARILTMDGEVIQRGSILIQGDRIVRIGVEITPPDRVRRIDAAGLTVTPGLIDIHGTLGLTGAGSGGDTTHHAFDAFNRYAMDDVREAYRNGVTTAYLPARGGPGINGTAAIVRLTADRNGVSAGEILREDVALCINLGSSTGAISRLNTLDGIRKRFRDALQYRESREAYLEDDLPEYEKKIKERAEKEAENGEGNGGNGKNGNGTMQDEKPAGNDAEKKKEEEIKKPAEPPVNRQKDILLRALDRELAVRILADRAEDILNAIDLAAEFHLDAVIEGASDADLVAEELAAADLGVALGRTRGTSADRGREHSRRLARNARALDDAGVTWAVGSGAGSGLDSRFVLMNAQFASLRGDADPLHMVTNRAASFLGLDDRGAIASGQAADLVLWTGDPLDPGSSVHSVYIAGRLVYNAPNADDSDGGDDS